MAFLGSCYATPAERSDAGGSASQRAYAAGARANTSRTRPCRLAVLASILAGARLVSTLKGGRPHLLQAFRHCFHQGIYLIFTHHRGDCCGAGIDHDESSVEKVVKEEVQAK
jgi:hypothetical protein